MLKHRNISIFVPNNGCPHMCSFCDQFKITGAIKQPTKNDITEAINNSKIYQSDPFGKKIKTEIAFFGGSFTAIKKDYMKSLLSYAHKYIKSGIVDGIRISTRPDCISTEILSCLKSYGVTSIELGAQSMRDKVLSANNRGHTSDEVRSASEMIKRYGFELGLQMMTGLYMSDRNDDIYTAMEFINLNPDTVRIYPTLIMKGTLLEKLYREEKYKPCPLWDAVDLCSYLLEIFQKNNIKVIRLGLHSSQGIKDNYIAGPWHCAFRELCESKILVTNCIDKIKHLNLEGKHIQISAHYKDISRLVGYKKLGLEKIKELCPNVKIIEDRNLLKGSLTVKEWGNLCD